MKKHAIVTISIGERPFAEKSIQSIKEYADRIGCDFRLITDWPDEVEYTFPIGRKGNIAYMYKLLACNEALVDYSRIIWLDDTCVVSADCPNLFEVVPEEFFAANNEGSLNWTLSGVSTVEMCKSSGLPHNTIVAANYFNSGIMVISRHHKFMFEDRSIQRYGKAGYFKNAYPEQTYLNFVVRNYGVAFWPLQHIFNKMLVYPVEINGRRQDYCNMEPEDTLAVRDIEEFDWLSRDGLEPTSANHAYIWHITSFYSSEKRAKIIDTLYRLSREPRGFYTLGLQRSGTNFMSSIIKLNFGLERDLAESPYSSKNWKHRVEPHEEMQSWPIIVVWKHPYHWLESIGWRDQKDWQWTQTRYSITETDPALMFGKEGQQVSILHALKTWRDFYQNWWFNLSPGIKARTVLVKYETLLRAPERVIEAIETRFNLQRQTPDLQVPSRVNESASFRPENISRYETDAPSRLVRPYLDTIQTIISPAMLSQMEKQSL